MSNKSNKTNEAFLDTKYFKKKYIIYCSCGKKVGFWKESVKWIYKVYYERFKYNEDTRTCRYCREED